MPVTRPVTQLRMFRVILALRWLALALIPVQMWLEQLESYPWIAAAVIVAAAAYTLLLTVFARRVLRLHAAGWGFIIVDLAVVACFYAMGPYTEWSFFFFSTTTILMAGLRGRVAEGLVVGVVWNLLTQVIQYLCRLPLSEVLDIKAIEDVFNLAMVAVAWSYSVGLVHKLNLAHEDLAASTLELERTHSTLDERQREILGLMDAGNALMRELELDTVLRIVVDALEQMGFGPCRVWTLDNGVLHSVYPADGDVPDVPLASGGPLARAIQRHAPVSVSPGKRGSVVGFDPAKLAIAIPVVAKEQTLGVLALESVSGEPFDSNEIEMLTLFADQVALAIQHVRFFEQTQELAVAEDRVRITREIHDTVVQKIYGANLLAESLCHEAVAPRIAEKLRLLQETILAALKDLRFAVLNWDSLDWREDLSGLVERYADEYAALTGIAASVVLRGHDCHLEASTSRDVVRAMQAALSNVRRHACARAVQVELDCGDSGMWLVVRDNGRGFDMAEAAKKPAGGIEDMRHRMRHYNGTVEVTSAPGDGTQVRVWMPCTGQGGGS